MLRGNSASSIFDRDFSLLRSNQDRNQDRSPSGREAQCISHEIAHGPAKEHGVGRDITFASTNNRYVVFFSDQLIECRDFLDRLLSVKKRSLNMFFSGFGAGKKEQIIDNGGELFA